MIGNEQWILGLVWEPGLLWLAGSVFAAPLQYFTWGTADRPYEASPVHYEQHYVVWRIMKNVLVRHQIKQMCMYNDSKPLSDTRCFPLLWGNMSTWQQPY